MPRLFVAIILLGGASFAAHGREPASYPIVFESWQALGALGIGDGGMFPNKCYYYGDGGYDLSVSDTFLERYNRRGFSLNSLCMGLVSGVRFDPESGARLPTYVVVFVAELREQPKDWLERGVVESGVVSDELPLTVPQCFSRGVPFSDCKFRVNPLTGKRLSTAATGRIRTAGAVVDRHLIGAIQAGKYAKECGCGVPTATLEAGACRRETLDACEGEKFVAGRLAREFFEPNEWYNLLKEFGESQSIGFVDVSPSLPLGYGYALYAEGGAGSSPDAATVRDALDGKKRATEAKVKALKLLLETE